MTREAHKRLQNELAALRSRPSIEVPDDFMDYDDNLVASYAARHARIRQIQDLLTNAVVGDDPPDDGIAETETFPLGVRGVEDADIDVHSTQSQLGSGITGVRPGEQRTYTLPTSTGLRLNQDLKTSKDNARKRLRGIARVPYFSHARDAEPATEQGPSPDPRTRGTQNRFTKWSTLSW